VGRPVLVATSLAVMGSVVVTRFCVGRRPWGELVSDTAMAFVVAVMYAVLPLIWVLSKPSPGAEHADAAVRSN